MSVIYCALFHKYIDLMKFCTDITYYKMYNISFCVAFTYDLKNYIWYESIFYKKIIIQQEETQDKFQQTLGNIIPS
jgi:hypothetical protein